jgi:hypothetical protein
MKSYLYIMVDYLNVAYKYDIVRYFTMKFDKMI